jgi:D-galactarolactone isomerase
MAKKVNDLGRPMRGDQIAAAADLLNRVSSTIVFDQIGLLPGRIAKIIQLSMSFAADRQKYVLESSKQGTDRAAISPTPAQPTATVQRKPVRPSSRPPLRRMMWVGDRPHPGFNLGAGRPDHSVLLLAEWAPAEATRHRILVENPESLYGFPNLG